MRRTTTVPKTYKYSNAEEEKFDNFTDDDELMDEILYNNRETKPKFDDDDGISLYISIYIPIYLPIVLV